MKGFGHLSVNLELVKPPLYAVSWDTVTLIVRSNNYNYVCFTGIMYIVSAIFYDGRFGFTSNMSLFQTIICNDPNAMDLTSCSVSDACISSCPNAIGLRCYGMICCLVLVHSFCGNTLCISHGINVIL